MVLGLAIVSALLLGTADYLGGAVLRRDGRPGSALTYAAVASVIGVVVALAVWPFVPPQSFTGSDVLWSIAAGAAFASALPLLMLGMAAGPVVVIAPTLGLVSLAVPAIAGPLLGDSLSSFELVGLVITFPAAALVAISEHSDGTGYPIPRAIAIGVLIGALLGTAAVFFGRTHPDSGMGPALVAQVTATVLLLAVGALGRRLYRPQRMATFIAGAVGVLGIVAVGASVLAYQRGPVAVVAAVIGLAPAATVVLAWSLNDERIKPGQLVGFAIGIGAVILFAMG